ncbi:salt tolerance receptor-like cytoplasmic kinase 1 [Zingiber officinale]|uniref:salt tolerance receptor-like cytoplasmic kinase 1 n=1 Tax=Zingiber officinale TaxID=94328 RepID=UPI001C4BD96F|nr:salt tolerance receptor-like cytoplasmic kinase 1 [Zingiber officinale]
MFCGYRIPLWGCCRTADDWEFGPAHPRIGDSPGTPPEKEKGGGGIGDKVHRYRWRQIESLTGKFAPDAVVGEGGSSTVYLARLPDASLAAVKLHRPSERFHRAFRQELDVLLRLRHPHIVRLLGYCDDREEEGVLVLEYEPNGSLHEKLHGGGGTALPWARRMAVAHQVARALEYLHDGCDPTVIHGDVKAANVLLDGGMEAKLCDFGSARAGFSAAVAPPRSGRAMAVGSPGYIDPYYLRTGMVSKKSDVYSFGVLLLEIVTGEEAFDAQRELRLTAAMAAALRSPGERGAKVVDARLGEEYDAGEAAAALTVAAMCVGDNPGLRPSMTEVVKMLRETAAASVAPPVAVMPAKAKDGR